MNLAASVLAGDRLALARLLTKIENEEREGLASLAALFPHTGQAHLVGITGAPGTGKSTLVNQLALHMRQHGEEGETPPAKVAIVAVDPSSPFTGGAILGDRIRMRDLSGDKGVFIRSMASRGALGGLARATAGVVQALDAAGFGVILIETVGAGQAEVDIARTAQTTVVICTPGMGDEVQASKAGILEIADILVVNKADVPGAENTLRALQVTMRMARPTRHLGSYPSHKEGVGMSGETTKWWEPPVLTTIATQGIGIDKLEKAITHHGAYLKESGEWRIRERGRVRSEMEELLRNNLADRFLKRQPDGRFEDALEQVLARQVSPRQAISALLEGGIK